MGLVSVLVPWYQALPAWGDKGSDLAPASGERERAEGWNERPLEHCRGGGLFY